MCKYYNATSYDFETLKKTIPLQKFYTDLLGRPIKILPGILVHKCPLPSCGLPTLIVTLHGKFKGYAQCITCGRFGNFFAYYRELNPRKSYPERLYDLAGIYNRTLLPFWGIKKEIPCE